MQKLHWEKITTCFKQCPEHRPPSTTFQQFISEGERDGPREGIQHSRNKDHISSFQPCHRFHLFCLCFSLGKFPSLSTASMAAEKSSLNAPTCTTLIHQPHSAADGTSVSQRSWLHWGISEDKSHLLSCTRARTNTDKVCNLPACFTTAATRNSPFHLQDFMVSRSCVAGVLCNLCRGETSTPT